MSTIHGRKPSKSNTESSRETKFVARTPLVKKLLAIRKSVISSGVPLLDLEEIREERAARRGLSSKE